MELDSSDREKGKKGFIFLLCSDFKKEGKQFMKWSPPRVVTKIF